MVTDALNHASIIDGVRLCKARRLIYAHADMDDLEAKLREAGGAAVRMVVTDGVFSMDGDIAPLAGDLRLADRHGALVMVDDSHATGFIGPTGRGTAEHCGVTGRVDLVSTTFGKALGGATGGCVVGTSRRSCSSCARGAGRTCSRTRSRPRWRPRRLAVLDLLEQSTDLRDRWRRTPRRFRAGIAAADSR